MSSNKEFFNDEASDATFGRLQDGFAAIMLAASACDDHVADEELSFLTALLCRMKLYSDMSPAEFGLMMDRLMSELDRRGVEELTLNAVAAIPPELSETVYINAVDVVLVDHVVEKAEQEFLDQLRIALEVAPQRAELISKVMKTKNEG